VLYERAGDVLPWDSSTGPDWWIFISFFERQSFNTILLLDTDTIDPLLILICSVARRRSPKDVAKTPAQVFFFFFFLCCVLVVFFGWVFLPNSTTSRGDPNLSLAQDSSHGGLQR